MEKLQTLTKRGHVLYILPIMMFLSIVIVNCSSSIDSANSTTCSLDDNTTETSTTNTNGCPLLTRDTSSCQSDREAQGLSGFWLKFSCRVTLTVSGSNVTLSSDAQPDFKSAYFESTNACFESFSASGRSLNNNVIGSETFSFTVPMNPTATNQGTTVIGGAVGMSLNGVKIYNNTAAAPDNIFDEVATFDKCDGHPDNQSNYHFHIEPPSISQEDSNFIGVMRDGYPIYGRKDSDTGSDATGLDTATQWHTGVTVDSSTSIGHYHVAQQTSGSDSAHFITEGEYEGTFGSCTGCE